VAGILPLVTVQNNGLLCLFLTLDDLRWTYQRALAVIGQMHLRTTPSCRSFENGTCSVRFCVAAGDDGTPRDLGRYWPVTFSSVPEPSEDFGKLFSLFCTIGGKNDPHAPGPGRCWPDASLNDPKLPFFENGTCSLRFCVAAGNDGTPWDPGRCWPVTSSSVPKPPWGGLLSRPFSNMGFASLLTPPHSSWQPANFDTTVVFLAAWRG
jgi:hypothetical protein